MTEDDDRRSWTLTRRFEFIEWKLFWEGLLNRSDLEDRFDISTPQASIDLRNYREQTGDNLVYDATIKAFVPAPDLKPSFFKASADRLLLQLRAWMVGALPREDLWFKTVPPVAMAPDIVRHVEPKMLRVILRAIRQKEAINVLYQSLTNTRWRMVAPHALAFDGYRWHMRAWACDRGDFRDFVITRVQKIGKSEAADYDVADDIEWNTITTLRLCPHPGLSEEQAAAIRRDYGMKGNCRSIEMRLSLAYYFIMRMNLDLDNLPPQRAQVSLENLEEVKKQIAEARAETKRRLAD
ncbi:WYL domain-containing protein [Pelagerythrobacter marinus]|uniref:WYL domain-containing protein n=1 Tax=Pelagerythrobacter marinus TaxID=538382 RepID=UPI002AC92C59|nr:WYL domain-containing protein [Pelagerythrobacter marinus]WPZ07580.1 WYL domain-containing protein [Pelagerythrobacter marinus]